MTDCLQISIDSNKDGAVMYLRGRIDIESSPDLRHDLLAMLRRQSPPETIAIDLAAVSYMDTSGIATLVQGLKIARLGGIVMHLQGTPGQASSFDVTVSYEETRDRPTRNLRAVGTQIT